MGGIFPSLSYSNIHLFPEPSLVAVTLIVYGMGITEEDIKEVIKWTRS
jgi:hypothetical protein